MSLNNAAGMVFEVSDNVYFDTSLMFMSISSNFIGPNSVTCRGIKFICIMSIGEPKILAMSGLKRPCRSEIRYVFEMRSSSSVLVRK